MKWTEKAEEKCGFFFKRGQGQLNNVSFSSPQKVLFPSIISLSEFNVFGQVRNFSMMFSVRFDQIISVCSLSSRIYANRSNLSIISD